MMKLCIVVLLGSVVACKGVIDPVVCPAPEEDRLYFPLPSSLKVGDRWTYSVVKTHWQHEIKSLDTLSIENLTIRVIEHLQIGDQTYFALSDEGIYRIDEASRTRRYDTEAKCEEIVWDIWGPVRDKLKYSIEKTVINGYPCEDGCFSRHGPFVQSWTPDPEDLEYYLGLRWYFQTPWKTSYHDDYYSLGNLLDFPHNLTYAEILKYPDWSINELYLFHETQWVTDNYPTWNLVVAPNVGVVYLARITHGSIYSGGNVAGKVGASLVPMPGYYKQKTEWILRDFQKGAPGSP